MCSAFIYPRQEDNPHASYHRDGTFHHKSGNHAMMEEQRQPPTAAFKGCEHLGMFAGHGPKTVGAICNPANFSDVIEVAPGILGPGSGFVAVDLVEPGCQPLDLGNPVVETRVFKDSIPLIVVRVGNPSLDWNVAPVFGSHGEIVLHDIYIKREWVGSRRTVKQCHEVIRNAGLLA